MTSHAQTKFANRQRKLEPLPRLRFDQLKRFGVARNPRGAGSVSFEVEAGVSES